MTAIVVNTILKANAAVQQKENGLMRTHTKPHDEHSPLDLFTELAVEGTSSLVEAQPR